MLNSTKYIFKKLGWDNLSVKNKKEMAFQFVQQHLLLSFELKTLTPGIIFIKIGFASGGHGFSLLNVFSPVFVPPSIKSHWIGEGFKIQGWTIYR
jgi:hypothetical protein